MKNEQGKTKIRIRQETGKDADEIERRLKVELKVEDDDRRGPDKPEDDFDDDDSDSSSGRGSSGSGSSGSGSGSSGSGRGGSDD